MCCNQARQALSGVAGSNKFVLVPFLLMSICCGWASSRLQSLDRDALQLGTGVVVFSCKACMRECVRVSQVRACSCTNNHLLPSRVLFGAGCYCVVPFAVVQTVNARQKWGYFGICVTTI